VDLEQAVVLTKKLYAYARRAPAQIESVITDAWEYSTTSSSGQKVLAALRAFGLIEDADTQAGRAIRLSDRALRIVLDEDINSPARVQAIKDAALSPKWYAYCWQTWGAEMPPSMRSNLLIEHGFVDTTIDSFLESYKNTIAFSKLLNSDTSHEHDDENNDSEQKLNLDNLKSTPREVSMESISTVVPKSLNQSPSVLKQDGLRQDMFSLDEGTVLFQWPASLSQASFEDLDDWIELLRRKIKRSVDSAKANEPTDD
jgi:hypothetical protein